MTKSTKQGLSRRHLFGTPLALAAGTVAAPALLAALSGEATAHNGGNGHPKVDPKYYPVRHFRPDISLRNKLVLVTGASRGNGRAIAEALATLGASVIGTSRNPATVPNPPSYPLLKLDIANPASVAAFPALLTAHPKFQQRGKLDILCNNAGRMVLGSIVPMPPTDPAFYFAQRELGTRTLYLGHVMMTNAMLPLMPTSGYARIMYTITSLSYLTGFATPGGAYMDVYNSSKAALRGYANCLAAALRDGQSNIRVSCVHPYAMHTALSTYPNPIYTQPVNGSGLSVTDQIFNAVAQGGQQLLANALPTTMIGETYAQLLQMTEPELNVVVGSPKEPLATQGANSFIEDALLAENDVSALPFK